MTVCVDLMTGVTILRVLPHIPWFSRTLKNVPFSIGWLETAY